jgi:hypothetical protein
VRPPASIASAMPTSTAAPVIPAVITLSAVRPRELEVFVVVVVFISCCSLVSSRRFLRYLDGALRSARAPSGDHPVHRMNVPPPTGGPRATSFTFPFNFTGQAAAPWRDRWPPILSTPTPPAAS